MQNVEMALTGLGGPERIERRVAEVGAPGRGRVLVRVLASGVSFAEVQMLRGKYPMQPKFPFVPGYDLVGTVVETGPGVDAGLLGSTVAAMTRTGAWREHVELRADRLTPVPAGLSPVDAVSLVVSGVTAYQLLHRAAPVEAGDTVLVHGAGGGVGALLTQLALREGVRVIGTASAGKQQALRELGAEGVDYRADSVPDAVRALAPNGVAAVYDHLGFPSLRDSWHLLAPGGTLVSYGSLGTANDDSGWFGGYAVPLGRALLTWNLRPGRRKLRSYYVAQNAALRTDLAELFRLAAAGEITPPVADTLPLTDAASAVRRLADGGVPGKLVLVPA